MKVDIDRLKEDPDYWDEIGAPEGSTHAYNNRGVVPSDGWEKYDGETLFEWNEGRRVWSKYESGEDVEFILKERIPRPKKSEEVALNWDESVRGPRMSGTSGNRIWKYQMPVAEQFTMDLPKGAQIIRMAGENGYLWLWAVVDTAAPIEKRKFESFKAGGTMPDDLSNHVFRGMAHIYIQAELMLYIFEVVED